MILLYIGTVVHNQTNEVENRLLKTAIRGGRRRHIFEFLELALTYVHNLSKRRETASHIEESVVYRVLPEYDRKVSWCR